MKLREVTEENGKETEKNTSSGLYKTIVGMRKNINN